MFSLAAIAARGHVPQRTLVFITSNTQHLCTFLFVVFPWVRGQLHAFKMACRTSRSTVQAIVKTTSANPSSHNEGNMNKHVIIPCCLNNGRCGWNILSLLRVRVRDEGKRCVSPLSTHWSRCFPFFFFSTVQGFTSWVSFSVRGLVCGLLCK